MPKPQRFKKPTTHKNAQRERQLAKTVQQSKEILERLAKGGK
jgi:hypothetical protein